MKKEKSIMIKRYKLLEVQVCFVFPQASSSSTIFNFNKVLLSEDEIIDASPSRFFDLNGVVKLRKVL